VRNNFKILENYIKSLNNQNEEENNPINDNCNSEENMAHQPLYNLNSDPAMDALINLVSKQRKEIRKMEKLMTPTRAQEFIFKQNNRFDKKTNQWIAKKNNPKTHFDMLNVQDYDGDGLDDTIVTKGGKVYSVNGVLPKDTDYPIKRAFLMENNKHMNRFGNQQYDRFSKSKIISKHINLIILEKDQVT
jgi:hypothetical protein